MDPLGGARLYDVSVPESPMLLSELLVSNPGPHPNAGISVAIDYPYAFVGAITESTGAYWSGAVFVFDISDPTDPIQVQRLKSTDPDEEGFFGWSVAALNGIVVVGQPFSEPGELHVFQFDGEDYEHIQRIVARGETPDDRFGRTVRFIEGKLTASGDRVEPPAPFNGRGSLFQYEIGSKGLFELSWEFVAAEALEPLGVSWGSGACFGFDVHGSNIAISIPTYPLSTGVGTVWTIEWDGKSTPRVLSTLSPLDGQDGDGFGYSIEMGEGFLLIRAPGTGYLGRSECGSVYAYHMSGAGEASLLYRIDHPPSGLVDSARFGIGLLTAGDEQFISSSESSAAVLHGGSVFRYNCPGLACDADVTADGIVDVRDLLLVLADFGEKPMFAESPASVIAPPFSTVDHADILAVINNWGECQ